MDIYNYKGTIRIKPKYVKQNNLFTVRMLGKVSK